MPIIRIHSVEEGERRVAAEVEAFRQSRYDALPPILISPDDPRLEDNYAPNRKYGATMFVEFEAQWIKCRSQEIAYDQVVAQFRLDPTKTRSFIRQYREWRARQLNRK